MAKDVKDQVRDTLSQVVKEAAQSLGDQGRGRSNGPMSALRNVAPGGKSSNGPLSGMRGVAAGAGIAALAPLAAKGAGKAVRRRLAASGVKQVAKKPGDVVSDVTSSVGDTVGQKMKETVGEKVDEAGGVGGIAKQAAGSVIPGLGGGDDGGGGGVEGVGKGRRMPVQQAMDVAVPIETAYNQFTQFEDWPEFMHRVTRVTQEDEINVSFETKIWTRVREFNAEIVTQRPDERIKWRVTQGITHTGVITFHELAPRLTRVELTMDVDPGGLIEKAARGMRHVKRAARADLHRFKAYIEMQEQETGAWRGVIEDGEVVEDHDPSYDEEREYSDGEDAARGSAGEDEEREGSADEPEGEDEESQSARSERFRRQARASASGQRRGSGDGGSSSGRSRSSRRSEGDSSGGQRRQSASKD